MYKLKQTSPDKVNGKLVKYRAGDCLSVNCENGKYLGAFISEKFNKYYDVVLIEFYMDRKPGQEDFETGKFFGTRFGSWEELTYAVNVRMITCKYMDNNTNFEKVGYCNLVPGFIKDGYAYLNDVGGLLEHYLDELPVRIEKSKNAERFPAIAFVSKHLVEMKNIISL
jgi:hypothetical protein